MSTNHTVRHRREAHERQKRGEACEERSCDSQGAHALAPSSTRSSRSGSGSALDDAASAAADDDASAADARQAAEAFLVLAFALLVPGISNRQAVDLHARSKTDHAICQLNRARKSDSTRGEGTRAKGGAWRPRSSRAPNFRARLGMCSQEGLGRPPPEEQSASEPLGSAGWAWRRRGCHGELQRGQNEGVESSAMLSESSAMLSGSVRVQLFFLRCGSKLGRLGLSLQSFFLCHSSKYILQN